MKRHITVSGSGESASSPDICNLDLRVWATAPSVAEATARMSTASRAVISALTTGGATEVSTARFSIRTHHDHQGRAAGFHAETAIRAVVQVVDGSGDTVSAVLGGAVDAGGDALALDGLDFAHSDPQSVEEKALTAAVTDARRRAGVMADAAGVTVGEVLAIEQTTRHSPSPLRFKAMAIEAADMAVQPGTKAVTVDVRVKFALT